MRCSFGPAQATLKQSGTNTNQTAHNNASTLLRRLPTIWHNFEQCHAHPFVGASAEWRLGLFLLERA
eukprot:4968652-Alexandrium_andersonii.AAC.1